MFKKRLYPYELYKKIDRKRVDKIAYTVFVIIALMLVGFLTHQALFVGGYI